MTEAARTHLSSTIRALCGRLAVERLRRQQWALAADLRRQVLLRIQRGECVDVLIEELNAAIRAEASGAQG